jgi:predicted N-formylglutamate amidohydrolase
MPAAAALRIADPASEPHPVEIIPGALASGALVLCDHASNAVPADLGDLGLPATEFQRHIAYDIGAVAVARALAAYLDAPAILTQFSRLIIDPNRGRDDPTLVMRLSDGAVVPGNSSVDEAEIRRRIARFYDPYDDAISAAVERALSAGQPPCLVSVHTFTPIWQGRPRPWHAAILWDADPRFALPLLEGLHAEPGLVIGANEPYDGGLADDTIDRHATGRGLANALLEIRQDLVASDQGAAEWAERFARLLRPLLDRRELREPAPQRTRTRDRLRRH